RTSMMLAMFTLVIFTLVTGGTISGSFIRSLDDVERFGGGFDVRAVAAPVRPIGDLRTALRDSGELDVRDIEAVGTQSLVPIRARQVGVPDFADYAVRGVDRGFMATTTYGFSTTATGYDSDEEVWRALADEPNLAVVDGFTAPRRNNY